MIFNNAFSENLVDFDEASYDLMLPFLLRPFGSVVQSYRFNHHANISLNEINSYCTQLFNDEDGFVELSKHIVTHLYEQSSSAQIKTGDVLIVLFLISCEYDFVPRIRTISTSSFFIITAYLKGSTLLC